MTAPELLAIAAIFAKLDGLYVAFSRHPIAYFVTNASVSVTTFQASSFSFTAALATAEAAKASIAVAEAAKASIAVAEAAKASIAVAEAATKMQRSSVSIIASTAARSLAMIDTAAPIDNRVANASLLLYITL